MRNYLTLKELSEEDRPREKLLLKGVKALTNAELLAIIIGSGNLELNAVQLSQHILHYYKNNLDTIAQQGLQGLTKFKGIGEAKAISIISALEIANRRNHATLLNHAITSSIDTYNTLKPHLSDLNTEEFWIISLNRANKIIQCTQISSGGTSSTIADPKVIFRKALEQKASGIILAHNHPSGNNQPSPQDHQITKKLIEGGKQLEIPILDHIIFCDHSYYSFADEGFI